MNARTILFTGVGQVALAETQVPAPGPGEVLVQAAYTCVSPGTELRCLAGRQPGTTGWPYIPGYAMSGTVVERGPGAGLEIGARVFCAGTLRAAHRRMWGGHISHAVLPAGEAYPLPDGLDLLSGALGNLGGIAHHGARVGGTRPGELVAVVGLGPIGQLAARCHAALGARVIAVDRSPERVALARAAGVESVEAPGSLAEALAPHLPAGADVIVDATGSAAVLPQAIPLARDVPWGDEEQTATRYLVQGSYPADIAIPYQEAFIKQLTFMVPRSAQPRDIRAVLELAAAGRLALRDIVSDVRPPEAAPETYAELQRAPGSLLTVAFDWATAG